MKAGNKSILIAGASGFLGTYLASACVAEGRRMIGVSNHAPANPEHWTNFAQYELESVDMKQFLDGQDLESCFILSGGTLVSDSILYPAADFARLLPGIVRLLEYLVRYQKACHVVLFSSAAVYGNPVANPIGEQAAIAPLSPYGTHKWLAEELVRHYARIYGVPCSILRIFSAYGPGLKRQLFWDLANKYEETVKNQKSDLTLSGTGLESRDFIHAIDIARAALLVARRSPGEGPEVYNVASGTGITIKDAASILVSRLRRKVELRFSGIGRPGYPDQWQANIENLQKLGYRSSVDLESGLQTYAEWLHRIGKDST